MASITITNARLDEKNEDLKLLRDSIGHTYTPEALAIRIKCGTEVFTQAPGAPRAQVHAVQGHNGRPYVSTDRDDYKKNNLLELPRC